VRDKTPVVIIRDTRRSSREDFHVYRTAIIKSAIYSVIFLISTYIWKLFYGIHIYPFTWYILLIIYKNVHSRRNKKIEVTIILNFIELHFSIDWCETTYRRCRYLSVSLSVYPLGKNCWRTSQCHLAQRERETFVFPKGVGTPLVRLPCWKTNHRRSTKNIYPSSLHATSLVW